MLYGGLHRRIEGLYDGGRRDVCSLRKLNPKTATHSNPKLLLQVQVKGQVQMENRTGNAGGELTNRSALSVRGEEAHSRRFEGGVPLHGGQIPDVGFVVTFWPISSDSQDGSARQTFPVIHIRILRDDLTDRRGAPAYNEAPQKPSYSARALSDPAQAPRIRVCVGHCSDSYPGL